ncbi:MAG: BrnT family toxin [Oligoflexia bacterium]|nr:BrnT family toxin [Oligoflexia bacterium]
MLKFEWNEEKNKINRQKHCVWFEEAQTVFSDDYLRVFCDLDNSNSEERFIAIGYSSSSRLLLVVHCYRKNEQVIRIISARMATKKERNVYEERI